MAGRRRSQGVSPSDLVTAAAALSGLGEKFGSVPGADAPGYMLPALRAWKVRLLKKPAGTPAVPGSAATLSGSPRSFSDGAENFPRRWESFPEIREPFRGP